MVDSFSRHTIRVSVAQICQIIGWTSIHSSPLEILTDILQEYIFNISKIASNYAMLYGQLEPNVIHLSLAFKDMGISVSELEEYVTYVETSSVLEVPKYPVPKESFLNHLKPGSREVVTRPVHIHEHLPPMHPHLEDRDYAQNKSPLSIDVQSSDSLSPLSSPKSIFKKPGDPIDNRRCRPLLDENEGRPLREISSVMMTTSGFLSPAREGKLPEARTQPIEFIKNSLPPEETNLIEPNIETKIEKKKKPKTPDVKKIDKENKVKDEILDQKESEDEFKGKKLVTIKETSKLKALKTGAQKIPHKPPSPSIVPKKLKVQVPPVSYQTNPIVKQPKERSPKNDKKSLSPVKEAFFTSLSIPIKEIHSDIDVKLPSEPDKQKLNILKKISKVKEEHEHDDSKNNISEWRENNAIPIYQAPHLSFNNKKVSSDNSNFSKELCEDEIDAHIDVETASPASIFEFNRLPTPDLPKTTEPVHPKVPEGKKKKKEKKEKRDLDKMDIDKDIFFNSPKKAHLDDNVGKLKQSSALEVTSIEEDIQAPLFPSLTCPVSPGPGLIPWSNPLFPNSNPISPTMNLINYSNFSKKSQDTPTSLLQSSFSSSFSNTSLSTPGPAPVLPFSNKDNSSVLAKKKERKREKKLKDKIKKKKDKKEKNRPKDKSERKKLKLEKKEKAKLKLKKEKRERKKEKELANGERQEISTVPKITFKLGPVSPKDNATEPCTRKIVIKPIVKKDEIENPPDILSFVPELIKPQINSITPKPKSFKGGKPHLQVKPEVIEKTSFLGCVPPLSVPKPEPISSITKWDGDTNQLWICPACNRPDDGSPMIACDLCDYWYHWTCVGIHEAIENDWYCELCTSRREEGGNDKKKKHRKKKT